MEGRELPTTETLLVEVSQSTDEFLDFVSHTDHGAVAIVADYSHSDDFTIILSFCLCFCICAFCLFGLHGF